jgi:RNA polymerase primary sigma factor
LAPSLHAQSEAIAPSWLIIAVVVSHSPLIEGFERRLKQVQLLSPHQEWILASRARGGDGDARRQLVEANLRLVLRLALRHRYRGVDFLDLVQEGAAGLIDAVDRFDHRRGLRFSTLATIVINGAMCNGLERGHLIRLPPAEVRRLRRLRKTEDELRQVLGRTPHDDELAAELDLPSNDVASLRARGTRPASLDELPLAAVADDCPLEQAEAAAIRVDVRRAVASLSPRERIVIERRFGLVGERTTLAAIGRDLGVTYERVRQIEAKALDQLKEVLEGIVN